MSGVGTYCASIRRHPPAIHSASAPAPVVSEPTTEQRIALEQAIATALMGVAATLHPLFVAEATT